MTPKELREKKEKDLLALESKWTHELVLLKIQAAMGQCPNTAQISSLKKNIARLKTIHREKELNESRECTNSKT